MTNYYYELQGARILLYQRRNRDSPLEMAGSIITNGTRSKNGIVKKLEQYIHAMKTIEESSIHESHSPYNIYKLSISSKPYNSIK
jgi:hypothetical protein